MTRNPYACPECDGSGEVECDACGSDVGCEECNATGLDDEKLDVHAFKLAEMTLAIEGGSWEWLGDGGVPVGRRNATRTLAYADYARKPAEGPR